MKKSSITLIVVAVVVVLINTSPSARSSPKDAIQPVDAAVVFDKHCASCHGKDGQAKTFGSRYLLKGPPKPRTLGQVQGSSPFLSWLRFEQFSQRLFRVVGDNQSLLFRPRLGFLRGLRFPFLRHLCGHDRLNRPAWDMGLCPGRGSNPYDWIQSPDCKSGLYANSSTGAQC
jgi:hypothetical protein